MANVVVNDYLDITLPNGWKKRAVKVESASNMLADMPAYVKDDCPLGVSVVVTENGECFQLFEEKDISFILKQLRAQQLYY